MRDIFGWTTSLSDALDSQRVFYRSLVIKDWTNVHAQILLIQRRPSIRSHSVLLFNAVSPNSNQHQISPCNINAYSTPEVMRIKDMITQGEFSWYFNNMSLLFYILLEKYGDMIGEFVLWY